MTTASASHNAAEYTVTQISGAVKRTLEDSFGFVRVRGEISGWRGPHSSGHAYFRLKDEGACIDAVMWRGVLGKLAFRPEEGLEVVATGKISSYPGSSKYQIVIEAMEPAGAGALMAMLEERKKRLAAEGLFAAERKRPLPFLPKVIGVVTSPTGAVIRDILHRVSDRFPVHVLVWPVAVQGQGAAEQVAAAIDGFNAMQGPYRPEVLIVARGGGSLEDLLAFSEEIVVRAAAHSSIPLISAVGHETDVTLIDFAADHRAPTPTAAAEAAVPVRAQVMALVADDGQRMNAAMLRRLDMQARQVEGLARGLPRPADLLAHASQRLDAIGERLDAAALNALERRASAVATWFARLPTPHARLTLAREALDARVVRLDRAWATGLERRRALLESRAERLRPDLLTRDIARRQDALAQTEQRLNAAFSARVERAERALSGAAALLESLSYHRVLARGYAVIRDETGRIISRAADAPEVLEIEWQDGRRRVKG